jgi:hypothetical protein
LRLLRVTRKRPSDRQAANQRDELSLLHFDPSSKRKGTTKIPALSPLSIALLHRNGRTSARAVVSQVRSPEPRLCDVESSSAVPSTSAVAPRTGAITLVWGVFCQGFPAGPISFTPMLQFPSSTCEARFLVPTHTDRQAGARRSRQGWRVAPPQRLVLDGSEHDGVVIR